MPTQVHLVKAMVFPLLLFGCENWAIKKGEHWRIDAFELEKIPVENWKTPVGEDS